MTLADVRVRLSGSRGVRSRKRLWPKVAAGVLAALLIGAFGLKMNAEDKAREAARRAAADLAPFAAVTFRDQDLSLDPWRMALRLDNLEIAPQGGPPLHVDRLLIRGLDLAHAIPHRLDLRAEGLRLDLSEGGLGLAGDELRARGTPRLSASLDLVYDYAPEDKVLSVRTLALDAPGYGRARLTVSLSNVDLDKGSLWRNFTSALKGGELSLAPEGRTAPAEPGRLTREALAEIDRHLAQAEKDGNPRAQAALAALRRFAAAPGLLSVTAQPKEPVPFLYFFMGRNLPDILSLLRVEVREG